MTTDPLRRFLRRRGCPGPVVEDGLDGLLEQWERTTLEVEGGYDFGLDDYLNDMDARQLIEETFAAAPRAWSPSFLRRLRVADTRARAATIATRCLWGDEVATHRGWTPERHWWYFALPAEPGEDLTAELEERGFD